jgi:hypothetical protein
MPGLRRTLWMAAQVAIRQRENGFRAKFERYVAKDRTIRTSAQGVHRDHRQDGPRRARDHQERCRLPALRRGAGARWKNPSLSEP